MRVAILSGNAPRMSAVGNQIAEKVRFLQERGAEVCLFVQDLRRLHPDLATCAVELAAPVVDGPAWKYLKDSDILLVVYAQHFDSLQLLPALSGAGPRIIFDYLGVTPVELGCRQLHESLRESGRQRDFVWCADRALTTSRANAGELREATGFPAASTATMPLVVDTDRFCPGPRERYFHQKLSIDGPILLYVGRLACNKRIPILIEALSRLEDLSAHAVIVGDQDDIYAAERALCESLAKRLGVDQRLHWLGRLEDVDLPPVYRSADCLIIPSRHEGFCVPVIEAMASGLPVIASRSAALPETLGDAGLSFAPEDAGDLARQIRRVLGGTTETGGQEPWRIESKRPRRVAVVCFRFGERIVGGAETSLRKIATTLDDAGHHVEVFTTCTTTESHWHNDVAPGASSFDGIRVHRFKIDPHDASAHGEVFRTILDAKGHVVREVEESYLGHSIHSTALLVALRERQHEFDAIVTGPYLFGLTADVAREFPDKTLIVPCFHDEPLARLAVWPRLYGNVAGVLYHSAEEQAFAQTSLGVLHPNSQVVGAFLGDALAAGGGKEPRCPGRVAQSTTPYVVYCGRYSEQKNVPLLLEWARRIQADQPGRLDFVFVGQGQLALPREAWLHDLGRVDEATKRTVLAGALALVQLSTQESLSLVALEAWAAGTPVIAHQDCAVLKGQIERSRAGVLVTDFDGFASAIELIAQNPTLGENGRAFVAEHYASAEKFRDSLLRAIDGVGRPLDLQMRDRGVERARMFSRPAWQQRFAEFLDDVLTQPRRMMKNELVIEPMRSTIEVSAGTRSLLIPVRLTQCGSVGAFPDGPGRTVVRCEVHTVQGDVIGKQTEIGLTRIVTPRQAEVVPLPLALPGQPGAYEITLWTESGGKRACKPVAISLLVTGEASGQTNTPASVFLDTVQKTLPQALQLQKLPADYVDVTEGALAPVKRIIKKKFLHNFKHAYVDVMSRQQSQMNENLVLMIQQLSDCCAMLDHAVAALSQRLDQLEAKLEHAPREELADIV